MDMVLGLGGLGLSFFLGGWFVILAAHALMTALPLVMWVILLQRRRAVMGLAEWLGAIYAALFVVPWLVVLVGAGAFVLVGRQFPVSALGLVWGVCCVLTLLGFGSWARRRSFTPLASRPAGS